MAIEPPVAVRRRAAKSGKHDRFLAKASALQYMATDARGRMMNASLHAKMMLSASAIAPANGIDP